MAQEAWPGQRLGRGSRCRRRAKPGAMPNWRQLIAAGPDRVGDTVSSVRAGDGPPKPSGGKLTRTAGIGSVLACGSGGWSWGLRGRELAAASTYAHSCRRVVQVLFVVGRRQRDSDREAVGEAW